jgi:hypothetical protein
MGAEVAGVTPICSGTAVAICTGALRAISPPPPRHHTWTKTDPRSTTRFSINNRGHATVAIVDERAEWGEEGRRKPGVEGMPGGGEGLWFSQLLRGHGGNCHEWVARGRLLDNLPRIRVSNRLISGALIQG